MFTIQNNIKPSIFSLQSLREISPRDANRAGYEILRDVKSVREKHGKYTTPPFSVKPVSKNIIKICTLNNISEQSIIERAHRIGYQIKNIEYPIIDEPNINSTNYRLKFTTPTAFFNDPYFVPYFEPSLFWQNLISTWNSHSDAKIDKNFAGQIMSLAYVMRTGTELETKKLDTDIVFTGFTGYAEIQLVKWAPPEYALLIGYLLNMAQYTGVGTKKAWGMGNLMVEEAGKNV